MPENTVRSFELQGNASTNMLIDDLVIRTV